MDVLVLGGTSFVGRWIVTELIARGHTPTLFHRGKTDPGAFQEAMHLHGDRSTGDYAVLEGHRWDAVVDVSAYVPRHVAQALDAVGEVGRYLFISTVSVYDVSQAPETGLAETDPRLAPVRDTEEVTGETYGGLKVACEDDLLARLGDRATIVRPGIVAGPYDPTDRFTYWARRAAAGGRVAVPGRLDQSTQVVDARDLANLCVQLLEDDRPGTYNGVGAEQPLRELITTCAASAGAEVELVEVPWVEREAGFPLLLDDPANDRMFRASGDAGLAVGLTRTPLADTARDTVAWDRDRGAPPIARAFTEDQERAALG